MPDYTGHLGDGPHNVETLIAEDDFLREYNDSFYDRHVRLFEAEEKRAKEAKKEADFNWLEEDLEADFPGTFADEAVLEVPED